MLRKIRIVIFVLVIGCISVNLYGQNSSSSPYSMFGVGDITNNGFGRSHGMGNVGSPLMSHNGVNPLNPASYIGLLPYTFIFEVGLSGNNFILKTPQGDVSKFDANIRYIATGFPITKWWKAGVGLRPISDIGYDIKQEITFGLDSNTVVNSYNGKGGVNSFYFDNSFGVLKSLSLGFKLAYVFGSVERTGVSVSNNDLSVNTITSTDSKVFNALSLGFGAHLHKPIGDKLLLNIGATYNLKTNLATDYEKFITSETQKWYTTGALIDTLAYGLVQEGTMTLPHSFSFGSSIQFNQKLELAFDYQLEKWSESKFFGELQNFKDNRRICFGLEYIPDYNSVKYFKLIKYRLGFSNSDSYLVFNNQQLKQVGGSLGFDFPLRSGTHINVAFIYNKRKIPGDDRLSENFFQIHLNFSLLANMFYRGKFE